MSHKLWLSLLSVCMLQAGAAAACIRLTDYYVVKTVDPAAMAVGLPLNTPIVIDFDSLNAQLGSTATPGYLSPRAMLHEVGSDNVQALRAFELGTLEHKHTAFIADIPLLPNTQYSVEIGDDTESPNAQPVAPVSWTITTGAEARTPLRLDGDLSLSFEAGTDPHYVCQPIDSICGPQSNCQQMGTDHVTKMRVQLPAAVDGFPEQYLRGQIQVSPADDDREGSTVGMLPIDDLVPGQPAEGLLTLPAVTVGRRYVPCVHYTVTDARGDQATTRLCADGQVPLPSEAPGATDMTITDTTPASPAHTSSACSVNWRAASGSGSLTLFGLGLLALLVNLRRRSDRATR